MEGCVDGGWTGEGREGGTEGGGADGGEEGHFACFSIYYVLFVAGLKMVLAGLMGK